MHLRCVPSPFCAAAYVCRETGERSHARRPGRVRERHQWAGNNAQPNHGPAAAWERKDVVGRHSLARSVNWCFFEPWLVLESCNPPLPPPSPPLFFSFFSPLSACPPCLRLLSFGIISMLPLFFGCGDNRCRGVRLLQLGQHAAPCHPSSRAQERVHAEPCWYKGESMGCLRERCRGGR